MDYYLDNKHAYERLKEEYLKYGKIIIAYDFDDTVYDFHKKGRTYDKVISLLREYREYAYFVVYSASDESRYADMRDYLDSNNIPYDSINSNVEGLNIPNGHKLYYNILLDDRAGLSAAYDTLYYLLQFIKFDNLNKLNSSVIKLQKDKVGILTKELNKLDIDINI